MLQTALFKESHNLVYTLICILFIVIIFYRKNKNIIRLTIISFIVLFLLLIWFYRIPDTSRFVQNDSIIVAPSDGIVKAINYNKETDSYTIIVFLNIFDQHHQYYPISGTISNTIYKEGKFHPAYLLEKSEYNERQDTYIITEYGEQIRVSQIAGQIARRIVNNSIQYSNVKQGEYMGMIKLSSRVDIEIPANNFVINVTPNTKIKALDTILATKK